MDINQAIQFSSQVQGWLSEGEQRVLYSLAQTVSPDKGIVELGAWQGKSTVMLAAGGQAGRAARIYTVDFFSAVPATDYAYASHLKDAKDYLEMFRRNLDRSGLISGVTPIRSHTAAAGQAWNGPPVGLLFIDADHRYGSVRNDFLAWAPRCAEGARIAFHDYATGSMHPGVPQFVNQLILSSVLVNTHTVDSILHGELAVRDLHAIQRRLAWYPVWFCHLYGLVESVCRRGAKILGRSAGTDRQAGQRFSETVQS